MYYTNGRMYDGSLCYSLDQFTDITPCYTPEQFKEAVMKAYSDGLGNGMHFERGDAGESVMDELKYYNETHEQPAGQNP